MIMLVGRMPKTMFGDKEVKKIMEGITKGLAPNYTPSKEDGEDIKRLIYAAHVDGFKTKPSNDELDLMSECIGLDREFLGKMIEEKFTEDD